MSATRHLSWEEDAAFRRLLDTYYTTEKPIPADLRQACRLVMAQTDGQREAVRVVLEEFFALTDAGWVNKRADAEIAEMRVRQQKQRDKANKRWHKPEAEPGIAAAAPTDAAAQIPGAVAMPPTPVPTPTPVNTPISPQGGKKLSAVSLKTWLEATKAAGEAPVPESDPVFAYADGVGIPADFLRLAWLEFRHRYTQPDAKRYRDWRGVFRKAVRGNWLKLWWLDPASNQYGLTTVGMQAQRAHQERRQA